MKFDAEEELKAYGGATAFSYDAVAAETGCHCLAGCHCHCAVRNQAFVPRDALDDLNTA